MKTLMPSVRSGSAGSAPQGGSAAREFVFVDWPFSFESDGRLWIAFVAGCAGLTLILIGLDSLDSAVWVLLGLIGPVLIICGAVLAALEFSAYVVRHRGLQARFDEAARTIILAAGAEEVDWSRIEGAPNREEMISSILATQYFGSLIVKEFAQPIRRILVDLEWLRIKRPDVIVDRRLQGALEAVPVISDLLEPEPVSSHLLAPKLLIDLTLIAAAVGLCWQIGHPWLRLWMPACMLGPLLLRRAGLLRLFFQHGVRPGESGLFAGVGYIERADGTRLGSEQAITLVFRKWNIPLCVRMGTRDRFEELHFSSPRDPGFIAFWQRWNHPHPRPELLGERPTVRSCN